MPQTKLYLICYDISNPKRLYRVRKCAYSFAFGGQKSAVEALLTSKEVDRVARKLLFRIHPDFDKVNIIEVDQDVVLLGKAKRIDFDQGAIII